jgi:hypothetical protein
LNGGYWFERGLLARDPEWRRGASTGDAHREINQQRR